MDQFSITDRLESTTPVRNPGPEHSSQGDSQPRRRKPAPKTEASDPPPESQGTPESNDDQNSHQIDELA